MGNVTIMMDIFILLMLFGIKHFIADFYLQTHTMVSEKGTYGAPGGLYHAGCHGFFTALVIFMAIEELGFSLWVGLIDAIIHYHIDWTKQQLNRGLTPADRKFWILLGLDQGLHYLTYVWIIWYTVLFAL